MNKEIHYISQIYGMIAAQAQETARINASLLEVQTFPANSAYNVDTLEGNVMSSISREELNAKLEATEARMDARVEKVSTKIEGFLAAQAERDKRLDAALAGIAQSQNESKNSVSAMKSTLIVTSISAVVAIVLGIAGFNVALTSNMMSAFQLGKGESSVPISQEKSNVTDTQHSSQVPGKSEKQ